MSPTIIQILIISYNSCSFNNQAKTATLVAVLDVGFLAGVILITSFVLHGDTKIDVIGFLAAGLKIVMYASPLAAMVIA